MIPQMETDLLSSVTNEEQPSYTYAMNINANRVIGKCDGLNAIKQAIFKILNTERYDTPIYSWNYGVELKSLFGKTVTYCVPELERRITEALMRDSRIERVYDFQFSFPSKRVIAVTFSVDTTEGTDTIRKEVSI